MSIRDRIDRAARLAVCPEPGGPWVAACAYSETEMGHGLVSVTITGDDTTSFGLPAKEWQEAVLRAAVEVAPDELLERVLAERREDGRKKT